MKKSLLEAFEIEKKETSETISNDYDIFKEWIEKYLKVWRENWARKILKKTEKRLDNA